MPTFNNGESGASVREKINEAINKVDGIESGATADQSASEIKTLYESNSNTNAFTDVEQSKLDGIEANADVTDTANVTAAGALMDSELTSEASVKALDQGVATTDSPEFAGVYLGGTGSANKLDDYEEGTWTPVLNTTVDGNFAITVNNASYRKIGKIVFLTGDITMPSTSSTTRLDLLNVPFSGYVHQYSAGTFGALNKNQGFFATVSTARTQIKELSNGTNFEANKVSGDRVLFSFTMSLA